MKGRTNPSFPSIDPELQPLYLRDASKKGVWFTNRINSSSLKGPSYWTGPVKRFRYHKVCNPEVRSRIHIAKHSLISYGVFHVLRNNVLQPLAFQQCSSTGSLEKQAEATRTTTEIIALGLLPCFNCSLNHEYHLLYRAGLRNQNSLIRQSKWCFSFVLCCPM